MDQQVSGDKAVQVGKYKITVIRGSCIGAGPCEAVSPDTFKLDAERKAVVNPESNDAMENILMAAQSCPARAIEIIDTETGEKVCPI